MAPLISVIIPAWNEEARLPETLKALDTYRMTRPQIAGISCKFEFIVVDDGSTDGTCKAALPWVDLVLRMPKNQGKGAAIHAGAKAAAGEICVFLDADLGGSAMNFPLLIEPLLRGEADMTIAELPRAVKPGGLGLVKKLAKHGVLALTGLSAAAPLSGQRAVRREILQRSGRSFPGFGVEVGILIDAIKLGYRIQELQIPFTHRETGRAWRDWLHRGKQFYAISRTLWQCWRRPVC
ncbi:glycosyltransferase family 2 protein [Paenibacillus cremeus]|uniref:Glucosyl-3-phosphoglycerate synthase n=1 Tax=Paenibacillus cremeus TaxID=2163881 RepID=A0A559KHB2_9BACL|nr:glycosyltransferase family 2 protein [Paenibacillus cremeus]TVY11523.1 glycosyltransferase family 2 protein [Paenibacillus cremeus]